MNINRSSTGFGYQARIFKALAHPARLKILEILRRGEACVCHLEAMLGQRQAYISQQLSVLKRAGLLDERREGLFVFYSLADSTTIGILDESQEMLRAQMEYGDADDLFALPERPVIADCPCPHCEKEK